MIEEQMTMRFKYGTFVKIGNAIKKGIQVQTHRRLLLIRPDSMVVQNLPTTGVLSSFLDSSLAFSLDMFVFCQ